MEANQIKSLEVVIAGLIETEKTVVARHQKNIDYKTKKDVEAIRKSNEKIAEWEKAKADLHKLAK